MSAGNFKRVGTWVTMMVMGFDSHVENAGDDGDDDSAGR